MLYIYPMKNFGHISAFILLLMTMVALPACDEQRRIIEPFVPAGDRIVLLEEFTGKGCTNCPKGSREIDNLLVQFPENLVVVSLHAGFFADPTVFPLGQYDLRTDEGEFLFSYLGPNLGYPSGVVNRVPRSGDMQIGLNQWASAITHDIQEQPTIDISLTKVYDPATRALSVTVEGIGRTAVSGEIRVSVMLTESGIIDAQDDIEAGGIVQDYNHKHVLRDMLTPAAGAPVLTNIAVGQTFSQTYTSTLPENWIATSMEVIAFVSVVNGSNFPVLQARSTHLAD